jgi:hypothetical protein
VGGENGVARMLVRQGSSAAAAIRRRHPSRCGATLLVVRALVQAILGALVALVQSRASLVAENLALRQQLAIFLRTKPRPRLRPIDRAFWVALSRVWSRWSDVVAIVEPATVIAWCLIM